MVPDDYISLDETLYPMRTQISFKQYNPDKPAKYGILFKSLNSARHPYTYQSIVYSAKPVGDPTDDYICGTAEYIKQLETKLQAYQRLQRRKISMDRLYTSIHIARWLLHKGITMVGTFQTNRVGIPPEVKDVKNREHLSGEIYSGRKVTSTYPVTSSTRNRRERRTF